MHIQDEKTADLSPSLQDYLETIYELVRDHKVARVKEIARLRDVRPGSVSPALRRLAELGLVRYEQREFIDLTPEGEAAARRVLARHQLLTRFLAQILGMEPDLAARDACALEHSLSDEAMDRLVRLFEFLRLCPHQDGPFLERFGRCALRDPEADRCHGCEVQESCPGPDRPEPRLSAADLAPGDRAVVSQIRARGPVRQRLLDMGILPGVEIRLERAAPTGDPLWIRLGGFQVSLRRTEAQGVLVEEPRAG